MVAKRGRANPKNLVRALHIKQLIIIQGAKLSEKLLDELQSKEAKDGDFLWQCLQPQWSVPLPNTQRVRRKDGCVREIQLQAQGVPEQHEHPQQANDG